MVNRVSFLNRTNKRSDEPLSQLNILISKKHHQALKKYAAASSESMSAIVMAWIEEKTKDFQ
ncbi:hypothetical protein [Alloscardovia criceti]|uniref:hypothetical protein n=1 Tax=Alloscardovia criceti TaxID=356828 RepID=UPI000381F993|nr:hypothetical protein [Alloscardovia criceti]